MSNATCSEEQNISIFLGQSFHRVLKSLNFGKPLRNANNQIKRIGIYSNFMMDEELVEFRNGDYASWADES